MTMSSSRRRVWVIGGEGGGKGGGEGEGGGRKGGASAAAAEGDDLVLVVLLGMYDDVEGGVEEAVGE